MRLATMTMVLALGAGVAVAQEAAAYGYVREVVFEPNAEAPVRVQVWGTFSVAAREARAYQIPEDGFLFETAMSDPHASRQA